MSATSEPQPQERKTKKPPVKRLNGRESNNTAHSPVPLEEVQTHPNKTSKPRTRSRRKYGREFLMKLRESPLSNITDISSWLLLTEYDRGRDGFYDPEKWNLNTLRSIESEAHNKRLVMKYEDRQLAPSYGGPGMFKCRSNSDRKLAANLEDHEPVASRPRGPVGSGRIPLSHLECPREEIVDGRSRNNRTPNSNHEVAHGSKKDERRTRLAIADQNDDWRKRDIEPRHEVVPRLERPERIHLDRGDRGERGERSGDRGDRGEKGGVRNDRGERGGDRNDRGERGGNRNDRGERVGDRNDRGERGGDRNDRGERGGDRNDRGERGGERRDYHNGHIPDQWYHDRNRPQHRHPFHEKRPEWADEDVNADDKVELTGFDQHEKFKEERDRMLHKRHKTAPQIQADTEPDDSRALQTPLDPGAPQTPLDPGDFLELGNHADGGFEFDLDVLNKSFATPGLNKSAGSSRLLSFIQNTDVRGSSDSSISSTLTIFDINSTPEADVSRTADMLTTQLSPNISSMLDGLVDGEDNAKGDGPTSLTLDATPPRAASDLTQSLKDVLKVGRSQGSRLPPSEPVMGPPISGIPVVVERKADQLPGDLLKILKIDKANDSTPHPPLPKESMNLEELERGSDLVNPSIIDSESSPSNMLNVKPISKLLANARKTSHSIHQSKSAESGGAFNKLLSLLQKSGELKNEVPRMPEISQTEESTDEPPHKPAPSAARPKSAEINPINALLNGLAPQPLSAMQDPARRMTPYTGEQRADNHPNLQQLLQQQDAPVNRGAPSEQLMNQMHSVSLPGLLGMSTNMPPIMSAPSMPPGHSVSGPHMSGPHMSGPHMSGPHMSGPHMSGSHMSGLHMSGPHMSGPNMSGPNMSGLNMSGPNMSGLNVSGPNMSGPNMSGPHMSAMNPALQHAIHAQRKIPSPINFGNKPPLGSQHLVAPAPTYPLNPQLQMMFNQQQQNSLSTQRSQMNASPIFGMRNHSGYNPNINPSVNHPAVNHAHMNPSPNLSSLVNPNSHVHNQSRPIQPQMPSTFLPTQVLKQRANERVDSSQGSMGGRSSETLNVPLAQLLQSMATNRGPPNRASPQNFSMNPGLFPQHNPMANQESADPIASLQHQLAMRRDLSQGQSIMGMDFLQQKFCGAEVPPHPLARPVPPHAQNLADIEQL